MTTGYRKNADGRIVAYSLMRSNGGNGTVVIATATTIAVTEGEVIIKET
jgi:hypothetical protein